MNERPDYVGTSHGRPDAWSTGYSGREVPMATYPWMSPESRPPMPRYYRVPHEREKGGLLNMIKGNPIPAALAAVGLGMLWSNRSRGTQSSQRSSYSYNRSQSASDWGSGSSYGESSSQGQQMGAQVAGQAQQMAGQVAGQAQQMGGQVQDAAGQVVDQVQNVAGQVQHQVQERAGQVQQQAQGLWQMVEANPAVTGALGAVLGGVTALLLPETEKENRLLGETRDRVVTTVQEKAEDTVARVQAAAGDIGQAAKEAGQAAMEELDTQSQSQGGGSGKSQTQR